MSRNRKFALFLSLALIGGSALALAAVPAVGHIHDTLPGMTRIIAGTLIVALAMAWACFFAIRAHFAQDEFKRQREISASFWGCLLGIAVSAPLFFFIAVGGLSPHAAANAPLLRAFLIGYLLPTLCAGTGAVVARLWLRYRDG